MGLALCVLISSRVEPAPPGGFRRELVVAGVDFPMTLAFLPDGRLLVGLKRGEIRELRPGSFRLGADPYLAIDGVSIDNARGLTDITLDPDFETNGYIYVYYSHEGRQRNRISRFTQSGSVADPDSEFIVWEARDPWISNGHYGGGLDIGPDGRLYLSTGDEKSASRAQDLRRTSGKIIRVNRDGTIPPDNPFIDGPSGNDDSIWARGFRNAFRARFDAVSGRLFVGAVGGDFQPTAQEAVVIGSRGANYGWPDCEGFCSDPAFQDPLFTYPHAGSGASIIGGAVYRGGSFPSRYFGAYFYGDYTRGWLRYLTFEADGEVEGSFEFDAEAGPLVFIDEGPDGALYTIRFDSNETHASTHTGDVERYRFESGNRSPTILRADADRTSGPGPSLSVSFSGEARDPEGAPLTFRWHLGDGTITEGEAVAHTFAGRGAYRVFLEVSDGIQSTVSDSITIEVGEPPAVSIEEPIDGATFRAGDVISFRGSASDADGTLTAENYTWNIVFHHNEHTHPGDGPFPGVTSGSFEIPTSEHSFHDDTSFEIVLIVVDGDGLRRRESVSVFPEKVDLRVATDPLGLTVRLDGIPRATPFVFDTVVGFEHVVEVPTEQCASGESYRFVGWDDGGSSVRTVTLGEEAVDLVARFEPDGTGDCIARVTDGAVAFYTFGEGGGEVLRDESGADEPLDLAITESGSVAWTSNGGLLLHQPTVLRSDGPASRLRAELASSNTLSFEAWVRPEDTTRFGPARIVALSVDPVEEGGNAILGQTRSAFEMRLRTNRTNRFGTPSLATETGSLSRDLTHVVFTRGADGRTGLWIDGALSASGVLGGDFSTWDRRAVFALGNEPNGGRPWLGEMRLVAVYRRALSQSEIAQNFAAGPDVVLVAPRIQRGPAAQVVPEGSAFSISVETSGSGPFHYEWFRDGLFLERTRESVWTVGSANGGVAGAYTVQVSNRRGVALSEAATIEIDPVPRIVTSPVDTAVCEGASLTLSVSVYGRGPFEFRWLRDGEEVERQVVSSRTATLSRVTTSLDDEGVYAARVTNEFGSAESAEATVLVAPLPRVVTQPADVFVCPGSAVELEVVATGAPPLEYQWRKDGVALDSERAAALALDAVTPEAAGSYELLVTNSCGAIVSTAANVTVGEPPRVVESPGGASDCPGTPVSLRVAAEGTAPFEYRWRRDGEDIAGATDSALEIEVPALEDGAAAYDVVVRNVCGEVVSDTAMVAPRVARPTVVCPPAVSVECESLDGVRVEFAPEARDDCENEVELETDPPSGSLFPPGETIVRVVATGPGGVTECSFAVEVSCVGGDQIPGDCDQNGSLNITDAICVLGHLFLGQPTSLPCGDGSVDHLANRTMVDWQSDGRVDLTDGVAILLALFSGGPPHELGRECVPILDCPANVVGCP